MIYCNCAENGARESPLRAGYNWQLKRAECKELPVSMTPTITSDTDEVTGLWLFA
jgi:hypothetical protein